MYESAVLFSASLLVGILLAMEGGRRFGRSQRARGITTSNVSSIEGALYALFGLLLAFTFSGATSRFDHRRDLIVDEANAVGTAYLRMDALPASARPAVRSLFRQYLEARLATYSRPSDHENVRREYERSLSLQQSIWQSATAAASDTPVLYNVVLPPLNEMFDIANTRMASTRMHPPPVLFAMLFGLGICVALLTGHSMADNERPPWMQMLIMAVGIGMTTYVILDIEYPRLGLVRVDAFDQVLREVLQSMK